MYATSIYRCKGGDTRDRKVLFVVTQWPRMPNAGYPAFRFAQGSCSPVAFSCFSRVNSCLGGLGMIIAHFSLFCNTFFQFFLFCTRKNFCRLDDCAQ